MEEYQYCTQENNKTQWTLGELARCSDEGRRAKILAVRRESLGKGRENGRERTPEFRVWPIQHRT
jgi:hypothetical protein